MAGAVAKWLVAAVLLAGASAVGLWQALGRPGLPAGAAITTTELLDLLKIALAVVGGLGAVVALAVAYRKQQVSEAAHGIATRQEEREDAKFANERYGRAAEQLGHESFAVRLAGVHAMIGLAEDWEARRQTCVDVLCGYLRTPYPPNDPTEREVRQAALNGLLDRGPRWSGVRMDFSGAEFEDLELVDRVVGGDLSFDHAVFRGSVTNFNDVWLTGRVTFRGAVFAADHTVFRVIAPNRVALDFTAATLGGRLFDYSTSDASRTTVTLDGVEVDGCAIHVDGREVADVEAFAAVLRERAATKDAGSR